MLLARQFVEMTRMKVENHLATFPKLIGTDRQHNTVETAEVRYVYQPIESLLLVLTTSKLSNIVEDLETVRLLSKLVPDVAGGVTEDRILDNTFELIFAFDEVRARLPLPTTTPHPSSPPLLPHHTRSSPPAGTARP